MRLKAVEMQGFKSFPDKTKITFERGITAIIGPNGSGKSNISDAVRWVLGEMSMKSLRGSKMEDVIFNGTPERPASNCAVVSLIIDSEAEYRAEHPAGSEPEETSSDEKPRLSDAPETVVTRKYYRSGDSEYFINRKQSRLKDIYDLFYNTGIGREGYSVISQGKIAEVLSQKGDERRSIFEEASGISRFRYQKTEAERKLADTENNLLRITDILSEVASRVKPLEKEAENARQYLTLSEEKKGLEITLWLNRLDDLREKRDRGEEGLSEAKALLERAQALEDAKEKELDERLNENYEIARVTSLTEQQKAASERAKAEAEAEKAVCLNDVKHYGQIIAESEASIADAERESERIAGMIAGDEAALTAAKKDVDEADALCAEKERIWSSSRNAVELASAGSEKKEEALSALKEEISELNAKEAALLAQLEAAKKTAEESAERIAAGQNRISKLEIDRSDREAERSKAEEEYLSVLRRASGLRDKQKEDSGKLGSLQEEIVAIRMKLAASEQKRENLTRMEQLFEGYSDSVRAVMRECKAGKIRRSDGKTVTVYGPVSGILSGDDKYVVALETSLGGAAQFIVVEDAEDAKACIRYLKDNRIGRATFLPVETVKGKVCDAGRIKGLEGYIGVASELTRFDPKFAGIVNDLLGRTVIADQLDHASGLARACGHQYRIVTLDGQVIHPGGSYTGGSPAKKVGVFTRAMDLERLNAEIRSCNGDLLLKEQEASRIKRGIGASEEAAAELDAEASERKTVLDGLENELNGLSVRIEEEKNHILFLEQGRDAGENGISGLEDRLSSLRSFAEKSASVLEKAEAESAEAKQAVGSARAEEASSLEALNAMRIQAVSKRSAVDTLSLQLAQHSAGLSSILDRIRALRVTVQSSENSISEREARVKIVEERIAEAEKGIRAAEEKLSGLAGGREEQERLLSETRRQHKEAQTAREEAFVRLTGEETNFRRVSEEFDGVTEKLWDEYEMTYSEAETLRLPPEKMEKAPSRLAALKSKIRSMGVINVNAVEEYRQTKERFDFLSAQVDDLQKTRRSLDGTISRLENEMRDCFVSTLQKINGAFSDVFTELFGGGSARIELQEPERPLESGIDIILRPPGKSVKSISLLSGGEQSFAAIALYLALQAVNPAPFCIFDEIESALDDVNLVKFADYIRAHSEKTQYIVITHRRGTMERADTLYGVTMHRKGVSDYIRLNLSGMEEKIKEYTD